MARSSPDKNEAQAKDKTPLQKNHCHHYTLSHKKQGHKREPKTRNTITHQASEHKGQDKPKQKPR